MNVSTILLAVEFAIRAHGDQKRKYTGEPYIVHPLAVARTVAGTPGATEAMVVASILHDTLEDTDTTPDEIATVFGREVLYLVQEVTEVSKPEDGNRAARKELDRRHFNAASSQGQTIKLADLLDNGRTIRLHDPDFSKRYFSEKRDLLRGMTRGNSTLWHDATRMVTEYFRSQEVKP